MPGPTFGDVRRYRASLTRALLPGWLLISPLIPFPLLFWLCAFDNYTHTHTHTHASLKDKKESEMKEKKKEKKRRHFKGDKPYSHPFLKSNNSHR